MRFNKNQVSSFSAATLATVATSCGLFFEPYFNSAPKYQEVLWAVAGVPILFGAHRLLTNGLLKFYYRRVLGDWLYLTVAESEHKNENYARMRFFFDESGSLKYEVELYEDMEGAIAKDKLKKRGIAESVAAEYWEKEEKIHILYDVRLQKDKLHRFGRLELDQNPDDSMIGDWESGLDHNNISKGKMFVDRPERFRDSSQSWLSKRAADANVDLSYPPEIRTLT